MAGFKPKIFISRPDVPSSAIELLKTRYELDVWEEKRTIPRDVLLRKIAGKSGLFVTSSEKIDAELLDSAGSNLRVVATMSVGYDHVDVEEAAKRNVKLGYTPGVLNDAVAELTVALLLARARRLFEGKDVIAEKRWPAWTPWTWLNGSGLKDSVVGIIGLGRIGTEVARRLLPFKVSKILYYSRTPKKEAEELKAVKATLEELLRQSDFVVVTVSLTKETEYLLGEEEFSLMKKNAFIVNTSRGRVLDQKALAKALQNGNIAGAALDVTDPEPLPPDHELLSLPGVYIIPHMGSAETSTRVAMAELTSKNIIAGIEGLHLPAQIK